MNTKRGNVTELLRDIARRTIDTNIPSSTAEPQSAIHFYKLAGRNEKGTLTEKEAQEICNTLHEYSPYMMIQGEQIWVEISFPPITENTW